MTSDRLGRNVTGVNSASSTDPNANLAIKLAVVVATTEDVTLSGLQTIDGVLLVANDRVLVKSQDDQTENGIYTASSGTWTRAVDADGNTELAHGTAVLVDTGTANSGRWFRITTDNPITIDETEIAWESVAVSRDPRVISDAAYTLIEDDEDHILLFTVACALTCPPTFRAGWKCFIIQDGSGAVTPGTTGGGTITSVIPTHTMTGGANAGVTLMVKRNSNGTSAQWVMFGYTA